MVAILVATPFSLAVGCGGPQAPVEEEEKPVYQRHTLDDLDEHKIATLDNSMEVYRRMLSDPVPDSDRLRNTRTSLQYQAEGYYNVLLQALEQGNMQQQRISAALLGFVTDPGQVTLVVPALLDFIPGGQEPNVNEDNREIGQAVYALHGLAELGRSNSLQSWPNREQLLNPIAILIDSDIYPIPNAAIEALGHAMRTSDDVTYTEVLREEMAENPDPEIRKLCIDALANVGTLLAYEAILSLGVDDPNAQVRENAISALGRSRMEQFVDPMIRKLDDPEAAVRMQAIVQSRNLGRAHENRRFAVVSAVSDLLDDRDPRVRERAILALGDLGDTSVVPDLIATLGERRESVRVAAILSLGKLRDPRATPPLILLLSAREPRIREQARGALVQIEGQDLGESASDWQEWYDAGKPRLASRGVSGDGIIRPDGGDDEDDDENMKPESGDDMDSDSPQG